MFPLVPAVLVMGPASAVTAADAVPTAQSPSVQQVAYAVDDTSKMLAVAARDRDHAQGLFGRIAASWLANRGNTDTNTVNGELDLGYVAGAWRHAGRAQAMRGTNNGVRNAESSRVSEQTDYTFSNNNYAFAAFDTNYDRFGPYLRRTSVTTGLGRRLLDTPEHGLDVQVGVGSSWTRRAGEGTVQEGVVASTLRYEWKINEHAALTERINVEARKQNTFSESITALTANVTGSLAMSLSYSIRHNTNVPEGLRKNDSATAVSLIYGF